MSLSIFFVILGAALLSWSIYKSGKRPEWAALTALAGGIVLGAGLVEL